MSIVATTQMFRRHRDLFSWGSLKIRYVMGTVFKKQDGTSIGVTKSAPWTDRLDIPDVQNVKHLHIFKRAWS
jgi:hypothetical protein